MKNLILTAVLFLFVRLAYGQEVNKETKTVETKMDLFSSKTGTITKFIDYKLPNLKLRYGVAETRIRKLISGSQSLYFYQIEKSGQYNTTIASVEYTDLLEVIKAFKTLNVEAEKDIAINPDYLENKFVTNDGFQVGYFVDKNKSNWYLRLEKYGSDKTLFINDPLIIETALNEAREKIGFLKK